jgi:hypothetical protein
MKGVSFHPPGLSGYVLARNIVSYAIITGNAGSEGLKLRLDERAFAVSRSRKP